MKLPASVATFILAEKPSVARDIAAALSITNKGNGYFYNDHYVLSWAYGHLTKIAEPQEMDPRWQKWRWQDLPLLPHDWPLKIVEQHQSHVQMFKDIVVLPQIKMIINAMDAGREGELIFRQIYQVTAARQPIKRLWLSSLTKEALLKGFEDLRDGAQYEGLAAAASCRSRADWLVGINLSRAYSLKHRDQFTIGRVQTPTLRMVVDRDLDIAGFIPERYCELQARLLVSSPEQTDPQNRNANAPAPMTTPAPIKSYVLNPLHLTDGFKKRITSLRAEAREKTTDSIAAEPNDYSDKKNRKDGKEKKERKGRNDRNYGDESTDPDAVSAASTSPFSIDHLWQRFAHDDPALPQIKNDLMQTPPLPLRCLYLHQRQQNELPPRLLDLTELQRQANRLFGFSAQKTLDCAQILYEQHKLITYPRTNSAYLTADIAKTTPAIFSHISTDYLPLLDEKSWPQLLDKRYVDDSKVEDHHAIIPTGKVIPWGRLPGDEARILDLICRHFLAIAQKASTTATSVALFDNIENAAANSADWLLVARGQQQLERGYKKLLESGNWGKPHVLTPVGASTNNKNDISISANTHAFTASAKETPATLLPETLQMGSRLSVTELKCLEQSTKPPLHLTEASLLTAMETAGRMIDDKSLAGILRGKGLGTPATRASMIESLIKRGYMLRDGKFLKSTTKGQQLIHLASASVKSPELTADWEVRLDHMTKDAALEKPFLQGISDYVIKELQSLAVSGTINESASISAPLTAPAASQAPTPLPAPFNSATTNLSTAPTKVDADTLTSLLQQTFKFNNFRSGQLDVCLSLCAAEDALVVMPTGAGKSLCYQIPPLALAKPALVIAPLIALMDDQVHKLQSLGLKAGAIHSNLPREQSRELARAFANGQLQYLFIAPERLRVPGFIDFLSRCQISLIAIDEAHCISQWGHDFRPDYRLLGQFLSKLSAVPKIALTATATPQVQQDICQQLQLRSPKVIISGFSRDNLHVQALEVSDEEKLEAICKILQNPDNRPAILYCPTRKICDETAQSLKKWQKNFSIAVYHAGMEGAQRKTQQQRFISGEADIVIATVAFGMGIDKANVRTVIHWSIPASVEGYYQEIGRAGRDGLPSQVVLMWSYKDRMMHDMLLDRDYPDEHLLKKLWQKLPMTADQALEVTAISHAIAKSREDTEKLLQIIMRHQGLAFKGEGRVYQGNANWLELFRAQRQNKILHLDAMMALVANPDCIMVQLCRYFGENDATACGHCSHCNDEHVIGRFRNLVNDEVNALKVIKKALQTSDEQSVGKLFRQTFSDDDLQRPHFDRLLTSMQRHGIVELNKESFERSGHQVTYQTVRLTSKGLRVKPAEFKYLKIFDPTLQ